MKTTFLIIIKRDESRNVFSASETDKVEQYFNNASIPPNKPNLTTKTCWKDALYLLILLRATTHFQGIYNNYWVPLREQQNIEEELMFLSIVIRGPNLMTSKVFDTVRVLGWMFLIDLAIFTKHIKNSIY